MSFKLRPITEASGHVLARAHTFPGFNNSADEIEQFKVQVGSIKEMMQYQDLLATQGATKQILDIMGPVDLSDDNAMADASEEVRRIMGPLSEKERELVYSELDSMESIVRLRKTLANNELGRTKAWAEFDSVLPSFQEKWREVVRRSKLVPMPPNVSTANNLEATMMAWSYVIDPLTYFVDIPEDHQDSASKAALQMVEYLSEKEPTVQRMARRIGAALRPPDASLHDEAHDIGEKAAHLFGRDWLRSGFAKLEVGHKLAASLAVTDVPDDVEVKAPWKAWSLVVPPGILGDNQIARVWCEGSEMRFFVGDDGTVAGPVLREMLHEETKHPYGRKVALALDSLVRGCCLALSNPDDYKKQTVSSSSSKPKHPRTGGAPDFGATRFMLSAPVTIDMREHLLALLSGKKHGGGSPTVQFLVRGHWKNQAHGPRHSLRKQIWVQPFWKGDESTRILLRNYKVKE